MRNTTPPTKNNSKSSSSSIEMKDMLDVPISLKYDTRKYLNKPSLSKNSSSASSSSNVKMTKKRVEEVFHSAVVRFIQETLEPMGMTTPGLATISEEGLQKLVEQSVEWQNAFIKGAKEQDGKQVHYVVSTDTIQGIALKYGTSTQTIKQINQLGMNGNIFEKKWLYLPDAAGRSGPAPLMEPPTLAEFQELAQILIRREFMNLTVCSQEESQCYVDLNDFVIEKAINEYQEDLKWQNTAAANEKIKTLSDYLAKLKVTKSSQKQLSI